MVKGVYFLFSISSSLKKVTPKLVDQYGEKDSYSLAELESALDSVNLKRQKESPYIIATHCSPDEFYSKFCHNEYQYPLIRLEVAKTLFGEQIPFLPSHVRQFANGDAVKVNISLPHPTHGSTPSNDMDYPASGGGGGYSGGSDGGGDGGSC